jgi:hypothetical protein
MSSAWSDICRRLACLGALAAISLAGRSSLADVPTPTVSAPPVGQHGFPFLSEVIDLASYGYVEDEVFIEGTARSYVPVSPLSGITDGRWDATPTGPTAAYKTRLLIRRPTSPHEFNGVVFVDWMNVTAGNDSDVFGGISSELLNEGYAYVGVSAQAVGVNFLRNTWEVGPGARYASLVHPGDSYSYDIFSQAAQALVAPGASGPAPLGGLTPHVAVLVAHGASQSGSRLITYINAVHPDAGVFDAFLPLITNNGSALSQTPLPAVPVPSGANWQYRTDSGAPVLHINSETEFTASARGIHSKPDTARFRLWEIAGSAHATRPGVEGSNAKRQKSGLPIGLPPCGNASLDINDMDVSVVIKAGVHAVRRWARIGRAPAIAPRVELSIPADPAIPAAIVRDPATGIAKGGIRVPDVDVPIKTLWGARPPADLAISPACFLFGAVDPWNGDADAYDANPAFDPSPTPEPSLAALYKKQPRYVGKVLFSTLRAVLEGYVRPRDAIGILEKAAAVEFP